MTRHPRSNSLLHNHDQGVKVKPTEHIAKPTAASKTGLFATLPWSSARRREWCAYTQPGRRDPRLASSRHPVPSPLCSRSVSVVAGAAVPKLVSNGNFHSQAPLASRSTSRAATCSSRASPAIRERKACKLGAARSSTLRAMCSRRRRRSPKAPHYGAAVNPTNGRLYVASPFEQIEIYDPNTGAQLSSFAVPPFFSSLAGLFENEAQIATDSAGDVYVPNAPKTRCWSTAKPGTLLETFTGSGAHALNGPTGVAVDSSGDVWVADDGNNRIEEFSSDRRVPGRIQERRREGARARRARRCARDRQQQRGLIAARSVRRASTWWSTAPAARSSPTSAPAIFGSLGTQQGSTMQHGGGGRGERARVRDRRLEKPRLGVPAAARAGARPGVGRRSGHLRSEARRAGQPGWDPDDVSLRIRHARIRRRRRASWCQRAVPGRQRGRRLLLRARCGPRRRVLRRARPTTIARSSRTGSARSWAPIRRSRPRPPRKPRVPTNSLAAVSRPLCPTAARMSSSLRRASPRPSPTPYTEGTKEELTEAVGSVAISRPTTVIGSRTCRLKSCPVRSRRAWNSSLPAARAVGARKTRSRCDPIPAIGAQLTSPHRLKS